MLWIVMSRIAAALKGFQAVHRPRPRRRTLLGQATSLVLRNS